MPSLLHVIPLLHHRMTCPAHFLENEFVAVCFFLKLLFYYCEPLTSNNAVMSGLLTLETLSCCLEFIALRPTDPPSLSPAAMVPIPWILVWLLRVDCVHSKLVVSSILRWSATFFNRSVGSGSHHMVWEPSPFPFWGSQSGPLYPKLSTCFEGAQLTQLVQLATAGRLFLGHKGRVDL